MADIFRKEALDKLQSPERLNEMVQITNPKSWIALSGLAGMLVIGLVWSFLGHIPVVVSGSGMLLQSEGVTGIVVSGSGVLAKTMVKEGDLVKEGDVLARLSIPEMELQIAGAEKNILESKEYYEQLSKFDAKDISMRQSLLEKKKVLQNNSIKSNEQLLAFYLDKIQSQEALLKEGLITKETILNTRNEYFHLGQQQEMLKNELVAISLDMFQTVNQKESERKNMLLKLNEAERNLHQLQTLYTMMGTIRSTARGKIIEILANPGNILTPGVTLFRVEQSSDQGSLEAILYVEANEGKRVAPGMTVKIVPSTIEVEEYGFMVGTVTYVSQYPSSFDGMTRVLGNKELAQSFISSGMPPISVRVTLNKAPENNTGFEWTSGSGPDTKIKTGTMASGRIEIDFNTPMELLFVKLKKITHIDRW